MRIQKNSTKSKTNKSSIPLNNECIGMDITAHAIHSVLLSARSLNQIKLEKYAITPLPKNILGDNGIEDFDQFVSYLQQSMRQLGSSSKNITVAMPQNMVSLQTIQYNPRQTELSLEEFVEFEATQSGSLADTSYDYFVLGSSGKDGTTDIMLATSRREEVDTRLDALNAASITPQQMDVDILAVLNAVNLWVSINQPELMNEYLAIFQVGHNTTSALIGRAGRLVYKQQLNLGHEHIMHLVRRNYQLSEDEAWNMVYAADKPEDYAIKVGAFFQDQLAQEIQRFLQFYYTTLSHDHNAEVQQILVSGYPGGANLGVAERIARQVNLPTQQINPILLTQTNTRLDKNQLLSDSSQLTVAFGLAVRGL